MMVASRAMVVRLTRPRRRRIRGRGVIIINRGGLGRRCRLRQSIKPINRIAASPIKVLVAQVQHSGGAVGLHAAYQFQLALAPLVEAAAIGPLIMHGLGNSQASGV